MFVSGLMAQSEASNDYGLMEEDAVFLKSRRLNCKSAAGASGALIIG